MNLYTCMYVLITYNGAKTLFLIHLFILVLILNIFLYILHYVKRIETM